MHRSGVGIIMRRFESYIDGQQVWSQVRRNDHCHSMIVHVRNLQATSFIVHAQRGDETIT